METDGSDLSIDVGSFRGAVVAVKVKKRPGMEKVNLLAAEGQSSGPEGDPGPMGGNIWDTLSRYQM